VYLLPCNSNGVLWKGDWVGHRVDVDGLEKKKKYVVPAQIRTPDRPTHRLVRNRLPLPITTSKFPSKILHACFAFLMRVSCPALQLFRHPVVTLWTVHTIITQIIAIHNLVRGAGVCKYTHWRSIFQKQNARSNYLRISFLPQNLRQAWFAPDYWTRHSHSQFTRHLVSEQRVNWPRLLHVAIKKKTGQSATREN
jgi:hypothetical protein